MWYERTLRGGVADRCVPTLPSRLRMYTKEIVCLANSRKPPSGRCVAGREYSGKTGVGPWIRPVSERSGLEISEEERRYQDGSQAAVLDVVRIVFKQPQPLRHQTENHEIHDEYWWTKVGELTFADILPMVQPIGALWLDGHSTYNGENDYVPEADASKVTNSLVLVRPKKTVLVVSNDEWNGVSRPRVRAKFSLGASDYRLVVTHPEVEQKYLASGTGTHDVSGAVLCVSLADFYRGAASKLVATVIVP